MFAFFSIDALHALGEFDNQNDGGDFGDWQSNPLRGGVPTKVQDAFATPGASSALTVELNALDVIGYDRVVATPPVVTADSMTPNAGTGATQTFALAYSDTAGVADLSQTWVWFTPTFAGASSNSCLVYYNRVANTLNLLNDAGTVWQSAALGSGTLANSQCALALGSSTAVPSGNTLTVTLALTFTPAFAGAKQVWLYGTDGSVNSSWQQRGTWTVPGGAPPVVTADSVTPNAGTGATQTFALAYSDTAGAADLSQTWVWFSPTFASASSNSCLVYYDRVANTLNLLNDAGTVWQSATLGSGTLANSQCTIALGSSTAVPSGNTLTVTLALTFTPAFAGAKQVWLYGTDGSVNSSWQQRGTWTVPGGAPPVVTADSVTPNAGTGATQTFALAYSDTAGAADLSQTWVWFSPTFAGASSNSCLVYYNRVANTLNLLNDAGTVWQSATLGSGTLANSQCALALGSSTAVPSGNTLTVTLALTFTPAFAGAKQVWLYGTDGSVNSSWQQRGTWTVPGGAPPVVTADSVTPNAGTGATQTFALAYSDTAGAADLSQTWVWFSPTFASASSNSCLVYYDRVANTLNLLNDAGTVWQSATLGSGTLANSQCTIALGSSTAVPSGNTLTVTLALTFTPAFAGAKQVWLYGTDGSINSGWQQRGTWTVPGGAPPVVTADSVTPNAGTGATQTFALAGTATRRAPRI